MRILFGEREYNCRELAGDICQQGSCLSSAELVKSVNRRSDLRARAGTMLYGGVGVVGHGSGPSRGPMLRFRVTAFVHLDASRQYA